MQTPYLVFKNPPLVDVGISVQFLNSLEVADQRGKFHNLIRAEFPLVVIPEQSKCTHDFGDYALYTENLADRLEIGMNYFRYITTSYSSFSRFRTMFVSVLSMFRRTYSIESFDNFFCYYNNLLPIGTQKRFDEIFTLNLQMPSVLEGKQMAAQGTLLFQEAEGHLGIEFKPEWKEFQVSKYGFTLRFGTFKQLIFSDANDELSPFLDVAHSHIEKYFFSLLQPKYLEFLEAQ